MAQSADNFRDLLNKLESDSAEITDLQQLNEAAPMGFMSSLGNRAKAMFGSTHGKLDLEIGKTANDLYAEWMNYSRLLPRDATIQDVLRFLKSKRLPTADAEAAMQQMISSAASAGTATSPAGNAERAEPTMGDEPAAPSKSPRTASRVPKRPPTTPSAATSASSDAETPGFLTNFGTAGRNRGTNPNLEEHVSMRDLMSILSEAEETVTPNIVSAGIHAAVKQQSYQQNLFGIDSDGDGEPDAVDASPRVKNASSTAASRDSTQAQQTTQPNPQQAWTEKMLQLIRSLRSVDYKDDFQMITMAVMQQLRVIDPSNAQEYNRVMARLNMIWHPGENTEQQKARLAPPEGAPGPSNYIPPQKREEPTAESTVKRKKI